MKKGNLLSICGAVLCCGMFSNGVHSQFNRNWPGTQDHNPNVTNHGWVGIGTQPNATDNTAGFVRYNLHLHGIYPIPNLASPPNPNGLIQNENLEGEQLMTPKSTGTGAGVRFGMTNTTTTNAPDRGVLFQLDNQHFLLSNRESNGSIALSTGTLNMSFDRTQNDILFGSRNATWGTIPSTLKAYNNIFINNRNGMYIRTQTTGRYGLAVKVNTDSDFAYIAYGTNQNKINFLVNGGGEVFARKYTTTLQNIPDYVFEPSYKLMPLGDLRTYLNTNRHLPNIPSATEMEAEPVDLGELTRLLLEKVEESTLYILQLEERIKALENGN